MEFCFFKLANVELAKASARGLGFCRSAAVSPPAKPGRSYWETPLAICARRMALDGSSAIATVIVGLTGRNLK